MSRSVNVTVGSSTIIQDAIARVRKEFPGASVNEILRYCALSLTEGKRIAEETVFGIRQDVEKVGERLYAKIPDGERELLERHVRGGRTLSEIYREGLYVEAGESPATARQMARIPRGPKPLDPNTRE